MSDYKWEILSRRLTKVEKRPRKLEEKIIGVKKHFLKQVKQPLRTRCAKLLGITKILLNFKMRNGKK